MKKWIQNHPDLWQFILFTLLSKISTLTRVVLSLAGTAIFVSALQLTEPFRFLIFNYTDAHSNGLGGFLTFVIAETMAQVVNFFIQKNYVFKSSAEFSKAAAKYAVLAVIVVVTNLVAPSYVTSFAIGVLGLGKELATLLATAVNTLLAVIVSFPLLKFWVMPVEKVGNVRIMV